jgi:hypothetical protein
MKGIMATVLALMLTGIVNSQQFRQNDFSPLGSGVSTRPTPDASQDAPFNTLSNANSNSGPGALLRELKPFELRLDADIIQRFRIDGELSSNIQYDIRNNIGEIVFGYPAALNRPDANTVFEQIVPVNRENNILFFEFSETDLKNVETRTLRYRLTSQEIGKIECIVVRMQNGFNHGAGRGLTTNLSTDPGRGSSFDTPGRLSQNPANLREINPPTNDSTASRPLDPSFPDNNRPGTSNLSMTALDRFASTQGAVGPPARREPETSLWQNENLRTSPLNSTAEPAPELPSQRRAEHLAKIAEELNYRETEVAKRERQLTEYQRLLFDELEKARRSSSSTQPALNWNSNQLADSRSGSSRLRGLDSNTLDAVDRNSGSANDFTFQRTLSAIAEGIDGLKQDHTAVLRRLDWLENQQGSSASTSSQVPAIPSRTNDRLAQTYSPNLPNPSLSNFQTQINGPTPNSQNNALTSNQSMTGPLFFMLCCSLGLNVYLGVVARNLYVRYNELADELRETFSGSVSP